MILDRAAERRRDAAWLAAAFAHPSSRLVPMWRGASLVRGGTPSAILPSAAALTAGVAVAAEPVWLGEHAGIAYFAMDLSELDEPAAGELAAAHCGEFVELRRVGGALPSGEAALLVYARGILEWHQRQRFCPACGGRTAAIEGGHVRACTAAGCGVLHYPRTDPAVIALVTHDDAVLLGSGRAWAPEMYSVLAGFVEPGESLEAAVARELREEAGVELRSVQYHSSQPWPFPASLMLGFTAEAAGRELRPGDGELRDVRWFTRAEIAEATARGTLRLSSPFSIARLLIDEWLAA